MKHSDAPFRLYKNALGKIKVWDETGELGTFPSSVDLDHPPREWKLIRGFTTKESFESYIIAVGRKVS
jgi:hypothetical protein